MRERERYGKRVGTVVDGRWRIDALLGWGSTAAVYRATHRNGHCAALKIIHQSLCSDASIVERFLREAGIANAIKHRAIVPVNDDGVTAEGCPYLVLELLEGETLDEMRARNGGIMTLETFAVVAEELMSAIAAVHTAGIIHRDLKPGNVFVTKDGQLKLLDFGTARIFDRAPGSKESVQGLVIGTPAFMSPEQALGSRAEVDAQSDVWSLGAMIFTVLSGEYVHAGKDQHTRLLAAASKPARSLASVAPNVDERVVTVVDRALGFAKEDRWPDVQSMRIAFRHAVVASLPTMRDLKAFADVMGEEEEAVAVGTVSTSAPALLADDAADVGAEGAPAVTAEPAALADDAADQAVVAAMENAVALSLVPSPPHSESETPAVTSTQGRPAVKSSRGIPLPALFMGVAAVAAMVFLVAFFVSGGDQSTGRSGAAAEVLDPRAPAPAETTTSGAPAASFIVISAPDDPIAAPQKKSSPPDGRLGSPAFSPSVPNASTIPTAPKTTAGADAGAAPSLVTPPAATREIATPYDTPEISPSPAPVSTDADAGGGGGGSVSQDPQPKGGAGAGVTGPASGASDTPN
jgi:serine/threonine protein kinase